MADTSGEFASHQSYYQKLYDTASHNYEYWSSQCEGELYIHINALVEKITN